MSAEEFQAEQRHETAGPEVATEQHARGRRAQRSAPPHVPVSSRVSGLLGLQAKVGNRAVQGLLRRRTTTGSSAHTIRRTFVNGSAREDAKLFDKQDPKVNVPVTIPDQARNLGITSLNMPHYLERHTYRYQRLNAKTVKPAAGFFPHGTSATDVGKLLEEALAALKDTDSIGTSAVSLSVPLKNGLVVNLGALAGGKLQAFFPLSGPGFNHYTESELGQIRAEKNNPTPAPTTSAAAPAPTAAPSAAPTAAPATTGAAAAGSTPAPSTGSKLSATAAPFVPKWLANK